MSSEYTEKVLYLLYEPEEVLDIEMVWKKSRCVTEEGSMRIYLYTYLEGNHTHTYTCVRLKYKGYRYCFYFIIHNLKLIMCKIERLNILGGVILEA